jgi:hypothetical protein
VITSPFGSATSAVASLTVISSTRGFAITMSRPVVAGANLVLGFNVSGEPVPPVTLLQAEQLAGPWTTNASAALATNALTGGFKFTLPAPSSVEFYQLRSP